jgi:hypothetical protein
LLRAHSLDANDLTEPANEIFKKFVYSDIWEGRNIATTINNLSMLSRRRDLCRRIGGDDFQQSVGVHAEFGVEDNVGCSLVRITVPEAEPVVWGRRQYDVSQTD